MATKIVISNKVVEVLEKPIERAVVELIAVGLYRDGKITLRQAADLMGVTAKEILEVIEKHDTYINYGIEELEEDIAYAQSGE
jgi:predicted HTH domain antitoxin